MAKKQIPQREPGDEDDADGSNLPVPLPPANLLPVRKLSEAEQAFLAESKEQPSGPTKLPCVTIDHKAQPHGAFILPDGRTIPGEEGLCGFIVAHFTTRTYYKKAYSAGGEKAPPECKSSDCIVPDADSSDKQAPTCAACPHNVFGTSITGKGKACKEYLRLFVVNPDFGDPAIAIITLPPSALSQFYGGTMLIGGKRGYLDQLRAKSPAWQVVFSRIRLKRTEMNGEDSIHVTPAFDMGETAQIDVAKALASINNQFVDAIKLARRETVVSDSGETE